MKRSDISLAVLILAVLFVIIFPLPPTVMDFLLIINISVCV